MRFVVICTRSGTQYAYASATFTSMEAARAWATAALPGQNWSIAQLLVAP